MAKAHIQEYSELATTSKGHIVPVGAEPALVTQAVTYTTATQSSAFDDSTSFVRIQCDADAFIAFGGNPTATANSMPLSANTPEYWGVNDGDKVSIYDGSS